jgi:hypothetical protein
MKPILVVKLPIATKNVLQRENVTLYLTKIYSRRLNAREMMDGGIPFLIAPHSE